MKRQVSTIWDKKHDKIQLTRIIGLACLIHKYFTKDINLLLIIQLLHIKMLSCVLACICIVKFCFDIVKFIFSHDRHY